MATEDQVGSLDQRELTTNEVRQAARAGELIAMKTPGAPLGVIAPEGLPRAVKIIGRKLEIERILGELAGLEAPAAIGVSGPPGVGKTVFAAEVVARAGEHGLFPGGAVWLSCEAQSGDPGLEATLTRLARAISAERATLYDSLHAEGAPRLLLALDGVESTLDAAALLDTLAGGRATLLLTSRQLLQDPRTRDEPLAPLGPAAATELFHQRFQQCAPGRPTAEDEPLIASATVAVGGLSLAIGLAASLTAITRQASNHAPLSNDAAESRRALAELSAHLDRSWAALPEGMRRLLAGLTLVEGATFPRGAALAVAGAALRAPASDNAEEEIASVGEAWREAAAAALDALIGLGLVEALSAARLRLHAVIRRYAVARLRDAPEATRDTLGVAMAGWWLDYARAHPGKDGAAALEAEAAGIMGAIGWARVRGRHQTLLNLASAIGNTWRAQGRSEDERHVLPWAVEAARALGDPARLRAALHDLALFDARAGRVEAARTEYEEALRLACDLGDTQALAVEQEGLRQLERVPMSGEPRLW